MILHLGEITWSLKIQFRKFYVIVSVYKSLSAYYVLGIVLGELNKMNNVYLHGIYILVQKWQA